MNWLGYSLLSAFFAALTAILAKLGVKDISSNLATAIRTVMVLIVSWGIVFMTNEQKSLGSVSKTTFIFLIASGIATGLSWLFYFKALQIGEASKVAPIDKLSLVLTLVLSVLILKEKVSLLTILGTILIGAGAILVAIAK